MKERIVIEKELLEKIIKSSPIQWFDNKEKTDKLVLFGTEYKTEKYPTNWEELKELSRKIDISKSADKIEIKLNYNDCLYVYKNGNMCCMNEDSDLSLCYNRTPAQIYQIIKNLIGEE